MVQIPLGFVLIMVWKNLIQRDFPIQIKEIRKDFYIHSSFLIPNS